MKFRLLLVSFAAVALLVSYSFSRAEVAEPGKDVKCPVSGKAVNPKVSVDFNGAKVFLCCNGCPDEFKANTAKYTAKANQQLVQTKQLVQVKCPLSGKDVDPAKTVEVGGVKVAFCCNNCKGAVSKATGDEQLEMVFGEKAAAKGFKAASK